MARPCGGLYDYFGFLLPTIAADGARKPVIHACQRTHIFDASLREYTILLH